MTRPPGLGGALAQFFPHSPKVVQGKKEEREKAEREKQQYQPYQQSASSTSASTFNSTPTAPPPSAAGQHSLALWPGETSDRKYQPGQDTVLSDASPPQTDDNESPPREIPNGVGSASSHASTVSSVFSNPAHQQAAAHGASMNGTAVGTPLTYLGSPASTDITYSSKLPMAGVKTLDRVEFSASNTTCVDDRHGASSQQLPTPFGNRLPVRDPSQRIMALRIDLSKSTKKDSKAQYNEYSWVRIPLLYPP